MTRRRDASGPDREPVPLVVFEFELDDGEPADGGPPLGVPAPTSAPSAAPANTAAFANAPAPANAAAPAHAPGGGGSASPLTPAAAIDSAGSAESVPHGATASATRPSSGSGSATSERSAADPLAESSDVESLPEVTLGEEGPLEHAAQHSLGERWSALGRRRKALLFTGVGVIVLALAGGFGIQQAQAEAHDKITVQIVSGSYTPSPDGGGLDLALTLRDEGPANATVLQVSVHQPGLALFLPPLPMQMHAGSSIGVILGGRYACNGNDTSPATTVTVAVRSPRGVVSNFVLPLPRNVVLPQGWQQARQGFCAAGFG